MQVALRLAQKDGQAQSTLTIHTFLVRWLANAQKQRRFSRSVAADIDSLLPLGRMNGPAAGLDQRLDDLLNACGNPVSQQADLLRLTHAIEHLKAQGWVNAAVSDEEWGPGSLHTEYADVSALLVRKSELVRQVTEDGRLTGEIEFIVVGNCQTVGEGLDARALLYAIRERHSGWSVLTLLPSAETVAERKCG
ncbi:MULTISPECIES: DUF2913 family protein [Serratia]|uniref:DUF2913 family protein n=1 Tax=Serratia TaxID=613 RepID=UPI00217BC71F|nr:MULTISPECIES: DUF2913 family protein [Serratia]CAI0999966.1 Protein of uncharacterised function (DUF2913) [Serratia quinivorans]CAI1085503.1 Protein of uncharacterised function (DUF2913) [Serratia quinivorans]CAI2122510.1 Protein of uncharacterised function (DUF2913) [Serratia quinivorans]CAI2489596.1 Protein of uncharacterised function (DUF2913) [Serratia liquefaciens]